jgi:hypothetical protein
MIIPLLLAWCATAHAEVGAMVGVRSASIVGDVDDDSDVALAAAGVVMYALPAGFAVGSEPGIRRSGSSNYRFTDLVLPAVGRYTIALSPHHRVRATLALAFAWRAAAEHLESAENGYEWEDLDDVRVWDIDAIAGVGYEYATSARRYFAELRVARSLLTLDTDVMPLAIYRRELGIWVGVSR